MTRTWLSGRITLTTGRDVPAWSWRIGLIIERINGRRSVIARLPGWMLTLTRSEDDEHED